MVPLAARRVGFHSPRSQRPKVPDYQTVMLSLLRHASDAGKPVGVLEMLPVVAKDFHLTEDQIAERLPSGVQGVFHNRLHWAKFYMTRAGLLESTRRGQFQITTAGQALLGTKPDKIDNVVLSQYPQFRAFVDAKKPKGSPALIHTASDSPAATSTPEELIDAARRELEANLRAELLARVRQMPPGEFEELVIQLLLHMGYGQGREEMASAIGGSGDGGVDGVVNQDPLGLDRVYVQAKRYRDGNTVGPAEINSFIGALNIKRANKGLFVTASDFTKQARAHAGSSTLHVVLLDGEALAELMVRHDVGVVIRSTVQIKAIDEGFFLG